MTRTAIDSATGENRGSPACESSNGLTIVETDSNGRYEIPVDNDVGSVRDQAERLADATFRRVAAEVLLHPQAERLAEMKYAGVEPTGPLPDSVDFPLYPQEEPQTFQAILFGDTQPRNQQEVDWIAHDVIEELIGTDASFGVTLGDIVFDDLSIMEPLNRTIALLGIPWYNVVGNHDINYDATVSQVRERDLRADLRAVVLLL